jgi:hypothetical protein
MHACVCVCVREREMYLMIWRTSVIGLLGTSPVLISFPPGLWFQSNPKGNGSIRSFRLDVSLWVVRIPWNFLPTPLYVLYALPWSRVVHQSFFIGNKNTWERGRKRRPESGIFIPKNKMFHSLHIAFFFLPSDDWWLYYSRIKKGESQGGKNVTLELCCTVKPVKLTKWTHIMCRFGRALRK